LRSENLLFTMKWSQTNINAVRRTIPTTFPFPQFFAVAKLVFFCATFCATELSVENAWHVVWPPLLWAFQQRQSLQPAPVSACQLHTPRKCLTRFASLMLSRHIIAAHLSQCGLVAQWLGHWTLDRGFNSSCCMSSATSSALFTHKCASVTGQYNFVPA